MGVARGGLDEGAATQHGGAHQLPSQEDLTQDGILLIMHRSSVRSRPVKHRFLGLWVVGRRIPVASPPSAGAGQCLRAGREAANFEDQA